MNNTNQLLLSLARNRWMKWDESLPSILKYFFLCSRCMMRYVSVHTCTNNYLKETKFEVDNPVCKDVIRCTKRTCTKISNSCSPDKGLSVNRCSVDFSTIKNTSSKQQICLKIPAIDVVEVLSMELYL